MEKEEIVELIKEHSLTEEMVKGLIVDALKSLEEVEADVTEETPIVKEEDVEVTKAETDDEKEEDEEEEEEEEEKEKSSETELEKSEEVEEELEKSSETELEKSSEPQKLEFNIDIEELKKSIKEELKEEVEAEVEAELLKNLSTERKPVAHEQPKVEKEAIDEEKVEKSKNVMSTREMAEHLIG